jgi:predicted dienelactone hydrolase
LKPDPHADIFMPLLRLFLLAGFCLSAASAQAAGFSTIEIPADHDGPALQGAVWTPCTKPTSDMELGLYVIPGVRDCPITTAQLPLIVVSHGYGGSFLGHHDTAEALANAGFVVAAINHSGDNYRLRGGSNDSITALATRTTDIRRLIDYMLQQWPSRDRIAVGQVGFFGFSRGGYTGLVLAGAHPDFERLPPLPSSACATAPDGPACAGMRQGFRDLLASPLARDTRIKAAVIADPFSAVFDADGLKNVSIPIQLWASEYGGDGVTPDSVAAVRRSLPEPPDWHIAESAAHFGFLAPCSPAQLNAKSEICSDSHGFDRAAFHADFNAKALSFFQRHLGKTPAVAAGT